MRSSESIVDKISLKRLLSLMSLILLSGVTSCSRAEQEKSQVSVDGAAVGFPISLAVAEEYHKVKPNAQVSVASSGTGGGISKFCAGDIDIADASRPITDVEIAACKKKGINFVELPIALDGIAVITNRENNFTQCLSIKELKKVWNPKSTDKVTNWNQVNANFPNQRLKLYGPASDTGTFDYFTRAINGKAKASRTDFTPSHNENILVQGVAGDKNALGYVGLSYYLQNRSKLNLVAVKNTQEQCEKPVPIENIVKNIYAPLSRPLFIYISKKSLDTKSSVREFINYYLENSQKWVEQVGYVELPKDAYTKIKQMLASGETGSRFKSVKPGQPITKIL